MAEEERVLMDPLQQLLLVAASERFVPVKLAGRIAALNALLTDQGKRMNEEMRAKWGDMIAEAVSDCEVNNYGLVTDMQKVCVAALRALEGRFYEMVRNDHLSAAACYEKAAETIDFLPSGLLKEVAVLVRKLVGEDTEGVPLDEQSRKLKHLQGYVVMSLAWRLRLPAVGLWDWAGDVYCRVGGRMMDGRRCYEHGLSILSLTEAGEAKFELGETYLCHLKLSLANILLANFDEWEKAKNLYKDVADMVFFCRGKKENEEYRGICSIIVASDSIADAADFKRSDWTPHVKIPTAQKYREGLTNLKVELGQRALDMLRKEFEKSEEGFPVPETYYLVAFLGELYLELKKYEKCADIVGKGESFDDGFFEWTIDELKQHADWAFPFVVHTCNEYFAKGLLQRPDYKEFLQHQKKVEESHQRQELRQIRYQTDLEKELPKISSQATVDKVQNKLMDEKPWLANVVDPGSVVNSEVLYEQLSKHNWGEVVMGYCNAVEEELKRFLYREYLAFRAESFGKGYEEESRRQSEQGSVLYFIASLTTNTIRRQVWERFVKTKLPEHREFLSRELPRLLAELTELRKPAAHGSMKQREKADKAREIVIGASGKPGLLERLVALHQSGIGGEACLEFLP